jgi:hypothetical protein
MHKVGNHMRAVLIPQLLAIARSLDTKFNTFKNIYILKDNLLVELLFQSKYYFSRIIAIQISKQPDFDLHNRCSSWVNGTGDVALTVRKCDVTV